MYLRSGTTDDAQLAAELASANNPRPLSSRAQQPGDLPTLMSPTSHSRAIRAGDTDPGQGTDESLLSPTLCMPSLTLKSALKHAPKGAGSSEAQGVSFSVAQLIMGELSEGGALQVSEQHDALASKATADLMEDIERAANVMVDVSQDGDVAGDDPTARGASLGRPVGVPQLHLSVLGTTSSAEDNGLIGLGDSLSSAPGGLATPSFKPAPKAFLPPRRTSANASTSGSGGGSKGAGGGSRTNTLSPHPQTPPIRPSQDVVIRVATGSGSGAGPSGTAGVKAGASLEGSGTGSPHSGSGLAGGVAGAVGMGHSGRASSGQSKAASGRASSAGSQTSQTSHSSQADWGSAARVPQMVGHSELGMIMDEDMGTIGDEVVMTPLRPDPSYVDEARSRAGGVLGHQSGARSGARDAAEPRARLAAGSPHLQGPGGGRPLAAPLQRPGAVPLVTAQDATTPAGQNGPRQYNDGPHVAWQHLDAADLIDLEAIDPKPVLVRSLAPSHSVVENVKEELEELETILKEVNHHDATGH